MVGWLLLTLPHSDLRFHHHISSDAGPSASLSHMGSHWAQPDPPGESTHFKINLFTSASLFRHADRIPRFQGSGCEHPRWPLFYLPQLCKYHSLHYTIMYVVVNNYISFCTTFKFSLKLIIIFSPTCLFFFFKKNNDLINSPLSDKPDNLLLSPKHANFCCCLVAQSCPTLLRSHELLPASLLCPWDFPGKDAGVGCHFLLQEIFPTPSLNLYLLKCRWILSH